VEAPAAEALLDAALGVEKARAGSILRYRNFERAQRRPCWAALTSTRIPDR